jgi:protein involved in polysaccharide export with SLBB domain
MVAPASLPSGDGVARAETHEHAPTPLPGIRYYVGDRVKLLLYEHLTTPNDSSQVNDQRRPHLVERAEFTGVYTVQENGAIVLPMLGSIEVDGRPIEDIAKSITDAFYGNFGRTAEASILLDEREPVYFIGQNVSSGSIKYTPGMTVLHVVANAGLSDGAKGDVYVRMELMRERERLQKSRGRLTTLLAKRSVLQAEARGDTDLKPEQRMILLAGAEAADKAIESERKRRQVILESRKPALESHAAEVAIATQKKAILMSKLQIADDSVKSRQERDGALENLKTRGDANSFFQAQVKGDLADVRLRRAEILNDISTVELELTRAQKELVRVSAEAKASLNDEITSVEDEIFQTETSLESSQRILEDLDNERFRRGASDNMPKFEIVRRTSRGPLRIHADEMTEVHPGDLVQIVRPADGLVYSTASEK